MIIGFLGSMGSGKTLSLTREVYKYYKKGFTVYSNVGFKFPHERLTVDVLLQYNNNDKSLSDCVVVIDEAHIFIDSRTSFAKRNLLIGYFLTQTRKKNVKLFYTTQRFNQIDKRLRENTDLIIECSSRDVGGRLVVFNTVFNTYNNTFFRKFFIGNKFFSLYDTNQIIKI